MSKKLSLREIEEAEELMNLPDHDDAQAVLMMDDIPDSDESPFDVYCFSSGHFFTRSVAAVLNRGHLNIWQKAMMSPCRFLVMSV